MDNNSSPYNFVPLENFVYFPERWSNLVSQDLPFSDGEDGIIEVTVQNETPLFIGGPDSEESKFSVHRKRKEDNEEYRWYFIPATTLKGCFRNVMEVLSFAKMGPHTDSSFGYRDIGGRSNQYRDKVKDCKCGWLHKEYTDNGQRKYVIDECVNGVQCIDHKAIFKLFPNFNPGKDHATAACKQMSLQGYGDFDSLFPIVNSNGHYITDPSGKKSEVHCVGEGKYRLVCTGFINGKHTEYLFDENQIKAREVAVDVIQKFLTVHSATEYFVGKDTGDIRDLCLKDLLDKEEKIPVFFLEDSDNISQIGITRMMRISWRNSVDDCIKNTNPKLLGTLNARKDLPETIFGYVDNKEALKGRVQFTPAFMEGKVSDDDCRALKFDGVLGSPKSSYWPYYATGTYDEVNTEISGRKRYRIPQDRTLVPETSDKEKMKKPFYPIPAHQSFHFRMAVHNLRPMEVGALLSAIIFNGTSGCYHNIGKAKSYGYGKIKCTIDKMSGFSKTQEDYIEEFETIMSAACQSTTPGFKLAESKSLRALVNIASEHNQIDMRQKTLEEFGAEKKENVGHLCEGNKQFAIHINENEVLYSSLNKEYENLCARLERAPAIEDVEKLCEMSKRLKGRFIQAGINTDKFIELTEIYRERKSVILNGMLSDIFGKLNLSSTVQDTNAIFDEFEILFSTYSAGGIPLPDNCSIEDAYRKRISVLYEEELKSIPGEKSEEKIRHIGEKYRKIIKMPAIEDVTGIEKTYIDSLKGNIPLIDRINGKNNCGTIAGNVKSWMRQSGTTDLSEDLIKQIAGVINNIPTRTSKYKPSDFVKRIGEENTCKLTPLINQH